MEAAAADAAATQAPLVCGTGAANLTDLPLSYADGMLTVRVPDAALPLARLLADLGGSGAAGWAVLGCGLLMVLAVVAASGWLLGVGTGLSLGAHGVGGRGGAASSAAPPPSEVGGAGAVVAHGKDHRPHVVTATAASVLGSESGTSAADSSPHWYVTDDDLRFFLRRVGEPGDPGSDRDAPPWEPLLTREVPGLIKFAAWRRRLPSGKTEYRTATTVRDASGREFLDLYIDDSFRPAWDGMIVATEVAEDGDASRREQVVRWTRKFPFSFITSRQYTIARRVYEIGPDLIGVSKSVPDHAAAAGDADAGVVTVDDYYSMWRSRRYACACASVCECVCVRVRARACACACACVRVSFLCLSSWVDEYGDGCSRYLRQP